LNQGLTRKLEFGWYSSVKAVESEGLPESNVERTTKPKFDDEPNVAAYTESPSRWFV
jgi:hypothetical protein